MSTKNAQHYPWGDGCDGWHLAKSDALSVIQERVPPGAGEVRHVHEYAEQFFFILSGTATIEKGTETFKVGPQQGLEVPPGVSHALRNDGAEDLIFLVISTPPSHGDRVDL